MVANNFTGTRRVVSVLMAVLLLFCAYSLYVYSAVMFSSPPLFYESTGLDDLSARLRWVSNQDVSDDYGNILRMDGARNIIFVLVRKRGEGVSHRYHSYSDSGVSCDFDWMDDSGKILGETTVRFAQNQLLVVTIDAIFETTILPGQAKALLEKIENDRVLNTHCIPTMVMPFVAAHDLKAFQNATSGRCQLK